MKKEFFYNQTRLVDWLDDYRDIFGLEQKSLKPYVSLWLNDEPSLPGRAPGDGVGGRARSPSVAQRATGVTLAAIAGLRRRFGLRDLEPDGDDDDRRENGADRAG